MVNLADSLGNDIATSGVDDVVTSRRKERPRLANLKIGPQKLIASFPRG